jgi:SsrA-binding protein
MASKRKAKLDNPTVVNRRARFEYEILTTLEVGIKLTGTEVKAVRAGKVSLKEGYVRVQPDNPPSLWLHSAHIAEFDHAAKAFNHPPTRTRLLLAHKREIADLAKQTAVRGVTIVPLKLYFKNGVAKLQIGVGRGKKQHDKRHSIKEREAKRDIERAMSKKLR